MRLDLDVSRPKCNNVLIESGRRGETLDIESDKKNHKRKITEQKKFEMNQALACLQLQKQGWVATRLPFQEVYSLKLLGAALYCEWSSVQHLVEARAETQERFRALTKVGNTVWGAESRILSVTAHSLLESAVSHGLAITGTG